MPNILLRLILPVVICMVCLGSTAVSAQDTFSYSGYLESDSARSASMNISVSGSGVTGTLSLRPVCQSNARLPGAEFSLNGAVSGTWEGKGSISGTWTGVVRWCEKDENRSGSFAISLGNGSVYFSATGSYYNRYVFAALGKVADAAASSGNAGEPPSSWKRPTVVPGAPSYSSLGPPKAGFQSGILPNLRQSVIGTVEMGLNETRLFNMPMGGNWFRTEDMKRIESFSNCYEASYYSEPGNMLTEKGRVGDGMNVTAIGEGIGRVYANKGCNCSFEGGEQSHCTLAGVWIVVVGEKGAREYSGEKKKTSDSNSPEPDIKKASVKGRVVMVGTKRPVGNAQISLISDQGGSYYRDNWKSGANGVFSIRADNMLLSGVYEVMAQWHSRDMGTREDPFTVYKDLWPIKKYFIAITKDTAKQGVIDVGDIEMDTVDSIFNSGKGRDSSEFRDPVRKEKKTEATKKKGKDTKQTSTGYNPFDDPNLKSPGTVPQSSDVSGADKLGDEFQSGYGKSGKSKTASPQVPVSQPESYTGRGEKKDDSTKSQPYSSGYPPYGYPPGSTMTPVGDYRGDTYQGAGAASACDDYQRRAAYDAGLKCGRRAGGGSKKMSGECASVSNTYRNIDGKQGWGACLSSAFDDGYRAGISVTQQDGGGAVPPQNYKYAADLYNKSGENVHIFIEGQENFGAQNKLAPGQRRSVNVNLQPQGGTIGFVAGRNGQVLSKCSWTFSPSKSGSGAVVTFSGANRLACTSK